MGRLLVVSLTLLVLSGCLVDAKKRTEKKEQSGCSKSKKTCIDALGASGKIRVALNGRKTSDSDAFTLSFDYIRELDVSGNAIKGKAGHSYENFAKAKFAFSELEETTIQGVKATKFDFQGTLDGPSAIMTVTIYIIKEEKNITLCDNSTYTVQEGVIKYNVELKNWTFCGGVGGADCKGKEGKYIDFGIEMKKKDDKAKSEEDKGKGKDGKEKKRGKKIKMGPIDMNLPDAVNVDNGCSKLAEISLKTQGSKQLLNLRFPRFKNVILYDPFLTGDSEGNDGSRLAANLSFIFIALMAAYIQLFY